MKAEDPRRNLRRCYRKMIRAVNINVVARAVGVRPAYSGRQVVEIGLEGLFLRMMRKEVTKGY